MIYLLGDLQGCCDPLDRMLATIDFSPSRDRLYVLGDLVNRGPESLKVLQRLASMGDAVVALLGNHDLHLLAVAHGVRRAHRSDTLDQILAAPECEQWLDWVRYRPLAVLEHGWLMVHAGVLPQWTAPKTAALAREVEAMLRGPDLSAFLPLMYGNQPAQWHDDLEGPDRWRCIINALTRLRFCNQQGVMEFGAKEGVDAAPEGYMPWFDVPGRKSADVPVAFGHWSTLGLVDRPDVLCIDTGCIWGGRLTAARIEGGNREIIQVECPQMQKPGGA